MHTDEAVHGVILGQMLEAGSYRYNPVDYHGPTLYYLSYPILKGLGVHSLPEMEAWQLRMITALIGSATILSLGFWALEFKAMALWGAGTLMAFSAPFVYYHRYFIHEGLFVLLSLLAVLMSWRFVHNFSKFNAVCLGVIAGLLFATKETATLVVAALFIAGTLTWLSQPRSTGQPLLPVERRRLTISLALAFGFFFLTFALFYSSLGTNPHGVLDAASSIFRFTHRAEGEGHAKPWWTYLVWIFAPSFYTVPWSGWTIGLLGLIGAYWQRNHSLVRFLTIYTLATLAIYSAIPYKTPWLELNVLAPACLLAGVGLAALIEKSPSGAFIVLPLVVILPLLAYETQRLCFKNPAGARNPLAYSPTVVDVDNLVQTIDHISSQSPSGHSLYIQVVSEDYWPLPWYLRHYPNTGYWSDVPDHLDGEILITSPDQMAKVTARIGSDWKPQYFGLRPDVLVVLFSRSPNP